MKHITSGFGCNHICSLFSDIPYGAVIGLIGETISSKHRAQAAADVVGEKHLGCAATDLQAASWLLKGCCWAFEVAPVSRFDP